LDCHGTLREKTGSFGLSLAAVVLLGDSLGMFTLGDKTAFAVDDGIFFMW